tara:strand:- start:747 stop:1001 length:255 start_codon:yes stop_codon:yes gene_type:complete
MITEVNLLEFGFKRQFETTESSGEDQDWYYYTLDIGDVCLITNSNDKLTEEGGWTVYLFDYKSIVITDKTKLGNFIHALKWVTI